VAPSVAPRRQLDPLLAKIVRPVSSPAPLLAEAATACLLVTVTGRRLPFDRARSGTLLPMHMVQIAGMQVCAFPSQVHPSAGTRPPPWHAGQ
jgi:hypothetical protein